MPAYKINKTTGNPDTLIAGGTLYADAPLLTVVSSYDSVAAPGWARLTTDVAGRTLSRTEYKELFDLVTERGLIGEGKPFGEGNGSTTFVLPDAREATFKGIGLTSLSSSHYDTDGVGLGQFIDDRLQTHTHGIKYSAVAPGGGSSGVLAVSGNIIETTENGGRSGATTEVKAIGINYFMKVKQVPVPADFVSAMDDIYGVLIPSNASASNKLVTAADNNFTFTALPSPTDFNTVKTPGVYTFGVSEKDPYHAPIVGTFTLIVSCQNADWVQQLAIFNGDGKTFVRISSSGNWSDWDQFAVQPTPQLYSNAVTPASGISTARNSIIVNGNLVFLSLFLYGPNNIPCDGSVVATISNASLRPKFDIVFSIIVSPRFGTEGQPATLTISANGSIKIAANGDPTVGEVYADGLIFPL